MRVFGTPVVPPVSNTNTGLPAEPARYPALDRAAAKPFVLEQIEMSKVVERLDALARFHELLVYSSQNGLPVAAIEVPRDDFPHPGIERFPSGLNLC